MYLDENIRKMAAGYVAEHKDELLRQLGELVAIPSVGCQDGSGYPYGKECARALDYALKLAESKGFEVYNGSYRYGLASMGTGEHSVGIFSHLDVVPAGEGWIYPPFACTLDRGWLFGRGVGDDKHAALLGIHALCALREMGLGGRCRFTVYFGCCEEQGMGDLDCYLKEQEQPEVSLVPDIRFPVCVGEKGSMKFSLRRSFESGSIADISAGLAPNIVPPTACAVLKPGVRVSAGENVGAEETEKGLKLTAKGVQSSSSMAFKGVNAVGLLFTFLAGQESLPAGERSLYAHCGELCTQWDGGIFGLACSDDTLGPLTSPCVAAAVKDGVLSLDFNLRYPATESGERIKKVLEDWSAENGWQLAGWTDSPPHSLEPEGKLVKLLYGAWSETTGQKGELFGIGGGTYARKLRNAAGFGPHDGTLCPFLPEGHGAIHSPDETRSLENILKAVEVYIAALWAIDKYYFD